jgi:mRNA-degrading endonuclease toxin of MazEF toxin-antitoxin module
MTREGSSRATPIPTWWSRTTSSTTRASRPWSCAHSRRSNEPDNVVLEVGEGNLPKPIVVVVSQVYSVEKARLGERIGSLSDTRVEQILAGLRFLHVSFLGR